MFGTRGLIAGSIAALITAGTLSAQEGPAAGGPAKADPAVLDAFSISAGIVAQLDVPARPEVGLRITVPIDAQARILELNPYSLRSDDCTLYLVGDDGLLTPTPLPEVRTMRGAVAGDPFSEVRASVHDGRLTAMIRLGDDRLFEVQPLRDAVANAPAGAHIVYSAEHVIAPDAVCGVDDDEQGAGHPAHGGDGERGSALQTMDLAFETDFALFQARGGNVVNLLFDIESIMNAIEAFYESQVDITFEITTYIVRTTSASDPYTTSVASQLLGQFQNFWNANFSFVRRDTAHLWTARNMGAASGGAVGIAFQSTLCNIGSAYGISQTTFSGSTTLRRVVTAHEIGHNCSATHCNGQPECRIMCASTGGCQTPTFFAPLAVSEIGGFTAPLACLPDVAPPIDDPFFDDFPIAGVDSTKWIYNNGGLTLDAVNPPSPPRALQLDATGAGEFRDNEVRSNFIMLAGTPNPRLTYWVQQQGVEPGEELVVEVWQSSLRWREVNRIDAADVSSTTFTFFSHVLFGADLHNEFRVRFRVEVDEPNDDWYIDDVYVGTEQAPPDTGGCCLFVAGCPADCFEETETNCIALGGSFQGAGTTCDDCTDFNPCDWNADGSINTADFFEFFAGFFGNPPAADYDGNGATNTADFFGFFGCFFAAPPGSTTFCP